MSIAAVLSTVLGFLVAGLILVLIRRDHLHVSHGVGWMAVAGAFSLLGFAPGIVDWLAHYLGISYPPVLALTLGIVFLVIKILVVDIEFSRMKTRSLRLAQRIAMLEADLDRIRNRRMDTDGDRDLS